VPLVRIIVPVFNRAHCVDEALESVLAQSHKHWELIAIDDGSRDDSLHVLQRFAKRDQRIGVLSQENQGAAAARNRGLDHPGDYDFVAFLDSDDEWETDHLQNSLAVFHEYTDVGVVFGRTVTCVIKGTLSDSGRAEREQHAAAPRHLGVARDGGRTFLLDCNTMLSGLLTSRICPHTPTVVMRNEAIRRRRFNTQLMVLEDVLLWSELAASGVHFAYSDRPHAIVRLFGDGLTTEFGLGDSRTMKNLESVCRFHRHLLPLCRTREQVRVVRQKIADYEYLMGQCYCERRHPLRAMRTYLRSIQNGGGWRSLRSLAGVCVPDIFKRTLRSPHEAKNASRDIIKRL
jgi:glycosyltransferase involved in cell wall biosynthesis